MIMYDYILTHHAKQRMKERDIAINELEDVLKSPDFSYSGKHKEINAVKRIEDGRNIRVVFKEEDGVKIIITAMVLE
jgi:hypothetical protein